MSLVNVSLKLWSLKMAYMLIFLLKKCICKSYSYFFSKNTCESDIVLTRTFIILTTNKLVKLTMLWTTGPWMVVIYTCPGVRCWFEVLSFIIPTHMSDLAVKVTELKKFVLKFLVKIFRGKAPFRRAMLSCSSSCFICLFVNIFLFLIRLWRRLIFMLGWQMYSI